MINIQNLNAIVALSKSYNSFDQMLEAMITEDGEIKSTILADLRIISATHTSVVFDGAGANLSVAAHEKLRAFILQMLMDTGERIRKYGLTLDDLPQEDPKP